MIRAKIVVEGRVQKVGYRDLVQSMARKLGVKGYVENLKDGNVQIICEAEEEVLDSFMREMDVKGDFIDVESVQTVEKSEATGEFSYFEIKYGRLEEEFGERMGTAIEYAKAMRGDVQDMHKDVKEDLGGLRSEVSDMHKDLRETFGEMHRDLKEDTLGIKEAVRDMHEDIKGNLVGVRGDIRDMHKGLGDEMAGVRSEIKDMHADMSRSFDDMAKRYDAISSELVRTREELTRAVDGLLKVIEEFIHERRDVDRVGRKG